MIFVFFFARLYKFFIETRSAHTSQSHYSHDFHFLQKNVTTQIVTHESDLKNRKKNLQKISATRQFFAFTRRPPFSQQIAL
jgi:hypothetical protein